VLVVSRRSNQRVLLAFVLAFGIVTGACGGGSSSSATKTAVNGKIDVNAYDPFHFDVKTINASPGPLTITLHEKGGQEHTFTISDLKFEIKVTTSHPEATGTVTLEAGKTYPFHCSYDGHAAAGMVGQIVVG
jgi:plastocyanin